MTSVATEKGEMMNNYKEVYFNEYCNKCIYEETKEKEDPCHECLATPAIEGSHKPLKFESRENSQ